MKIIRSSKCSTKFATEKKRMELQAVLSEYGKVVNIFIDYFWSLGDKKMDKTQLLKPIVDLPKDSWLSARLRKVAAREAIDMIKAVMEVQATHKEMLQGDISTITKIIARTPPTTKKHRRKSNNLHIKLKAKKNKLSMLHPHKPKHTGDRMSVSCTIAGLQMPKDTSEFDAWLHMASIGNKMVIDVPVRYHRHFRGLANKAVRLNSYVITKNYVQFAFERETGAKKTGKNVVGIDTGINALASTSNGIQYGRDIKVLIEKSKRCQKGSKGKQRAVNTLRQRICEVAKQTVKDADVVVVEKLSDMNNNSKLKGRLSLNMRSSIGSWNYAYWLNRVEMNCEESRASFRTVPSYYTSQKCPACGHTDSGNRVGEVFKCQKCGYSGNADLVAALNIRDRFLGGPYGAAYKQESMGELVCPILSKFA
jgi:putative transposase